jgi:pentatricopeptide repeat protein
MQPNVITMSAAISACEKGGQWERAVTLFESLTGLGVQPNVVTMSAVVEALDKVRKWERAMAVIDEGTSRGLFDFVWVSKSIVDLHKCPAAVARAVIGCLLRDLSASRRVVCDITIVTGQGNRSEGEAVLPQEARYFLNSFSGPTPCEVPGSPGHFVLTKSSIQRWFLKATK